MDSALFYLIALEVVISSIGVVRSRSAVYSVLWLVAAMCGTAALFLTLKAFLIAAIQVLVYAGAILVLFLFVVMLTDTKAESGSARGFGLPHAVASGAALLFFLQVAAAVRAAHFPQQAVPAEGTAQAIGQLLFSQYLLPFELTSFLILAAVISIVVLAKKAS